MNRDTEWMRQAACHGLTALMFPERGEQTRDAVATCAGCPVRAECLNYALIHHEPHGIWGGMSGKQRIRRWRADRKAAA